MSTGLLPHPVLNIVSPLCSTDAALSPSTFHRPAPRHSLSFNPLTPSRTRPFYPAHHPSMEPPYPAPVRTWHNAVYPAIDASKNPTSHEGQTVIITGAVSHTLSAPKLLNVDLQQGSGIGRELAKSFAAAGAKHVVLVGRTAATLEETKSHVVGTAKVSTFVADVTDEVAIQKVAGALGAWDVLVMNAGYFSSPAPASKADVSDYWKAYEARIPYHSISYSDDYSSDSRTGQCQIGHYLRQGLLSHGESHQGGRAWCHQRVVSPSAQYAHWHVGIPMLKTSRRQDHGVPVGREPQHILCICTPRHG
jgi:hypothetical protein